MDALKKHLGGIVAVGFGLVGVLVAGNATRAADAVAGAAAFGAAQPLLARYCLDCHSGDAAEAEVDLAFSHDAATLGKQKVSHRISEAAVAACSLSPP